MSELSKQLQKLAPSEFDLFLDTLPSETITVLKQRYDIRDPEPTVQQEQPTKTILKTPSALRLKSVDKGYGDADFIAKVLSAVYLVLDIFKTAMACMFVIFVPQLCPADYTQSDPTLRVPHQCTEEENFTNLTYSKDRHLTAS
ncbi:hypothetical protein HDU91_002618 [Kappamyces sp. JEL0680]|nr:hypothetical protein HDU91_002618 [Kappamyces sp. JEL0680]